MLSFAVDSFSFDALGYTSRLAVIARDRLGAIVSDAEERINYLSTDSLVSVVSSGAVQTRGNGDALIVARTTDGPADTIRVLVAQRVAKVVLASDSLLFESLNAEDLLAGTALDPLGSRVA